jgi:PDZ domain-containing protein
MRRYATPGRLAAAGLLLLGVVAAVLALAPGGDTYIFLPDEDGAHALAPLVTVEGEKHDGDGGGIFYVSVVVRKATLLERVWPDIHEGADLVPGRALNPTGLSEAERRRGNLREMSLSQQIAAAVALRELGYEVEATPIGVLVGGIDPTAPAAGELQPTDLIVSVDGERVRTIEDLFDEMAKREPGDEVVFGVRRGDEERSIRLGTIESDTERGRAIVGIRPEQGAEIDLPVDVEIETGDVGGPSAGLAFALDIVDELGRDLDRGRKIAVTGEIDLDGAVGPVGGLEQKTIGARRSGVDVFVVPAGDNAAEARKYAGDMRVVPVRTFQQALRALSTEG